VPDQVFPRVTKRRGRALYNEQAAETFRSTTLGFVGTELDAAETFSDMALETANEDKRARNCQNARKAYDTALHFLAIIKLTKEEGRKIGTKIAAVKSKLQRLGETF
jgi:hypothetical protein